MTCTQIVKKVKVKTYVNDPPRLMNQLSNASKSCSAGLGVSTGGTQQTPESVAGRGGELCGGQSAVPLHCNGVSVVGTQQAPESVAGRGGELSGGQQCTPSVNMYHEMIDLVD